MADLGGLLGDAAGLILPDAEAGGQGFDLGTVFNGVRQGVVDAVRNGPGAMVGAGYMALNPQSGMSARDRLFIGGATALGLGMLGREAYKATRLNRALTRMPEGPAFMAPGVRELMELGDRRRAASYVEDVAYRVQREHPGYDLRRAQMIGANDMDEFMVGLRGTDWDPGIEADRDMGVRAFVQRYSDEMAGGDFDGAKFDLAKFQLAIERGVFGGEMNADVRKAWNAMTGKPGSLSAEQSASLLATIRQFADETADLDVDLAVGPVGRVVQVVPSDAGMLMVVDRPTGWRRWDLTDEKVRGDRLKQLNYRHLSAHGEQMIERIYTMGKTEMGLGEASRFHRRLELGANWYPQARAAVAREFGLEDSPANEQLQRAVAAVSFLSEAERWETNVAKAHKALNHPSTQRALAEPAFLEWLRDPKRMEQVWLDDFLNDGPGAPDFSHLKASGPQELLDNIHKEFLADGMKVSQNDLKVVLRLLGTESVQDIFRTTDRRKQKNFYLNIIDPGLDEPVTIDRHAHSAFLGMSTGNFGRVDTGPLDDQTYDVIADAYRNVATKLGIKPNELQAVVWETWRILQEDPYQVGGKVVNYHNGWGRADPFRLFEQDADGKVAGDNLVFRALSGELSQDPTTTGLNLSVLEVPTTGKGLQGISMPDGAVAVVSDVNRRSVDANPLMYPAVIGADGRPRWAPVRAQRVTDAYRAFQTTASRGNQDHELMLGAWPALDGQDQILFSMPAGQILPSGFGAERLGRALSGGPQRIFAHPGDLDMQALAAADVRRSPLMRHQWAALSAERTGLTPEENLARSNELYAQLVKEGFQPMRVDGRYGGVDEQSLLVFGMTPEQALDWGNRYQQESVLIPDGLLYGDNSDTPNQLLPAIDTQLFRGAGPGRTVPSDNRSLVELPDGTQTGFVLEFNWDEPPMPYDFAIEQQGAVTKYRIPISPEQTKNVLNIASMLRSRDMRNVEIITGNPDAYGLRRDGFSRQYIELFSDGTNTLVRRFDDIEEELAPNVIQAWAPPMAGATSMHRNAPLLAQAPMGNTSATPGSWQSKPGSAGKVLDYGSFTIRSDRKLWIKSGLTVRHDDGEVVTRFAWNDGVMTPLAEGAPKSPVEVHVVGDRARVTLTDETADLMPAIDARDSLYAAGIQAELRVGSKAFATPEFKLESARPTVRITGGREVLNVRKGPSTPAWQRTFGFDFHPTYRMGNQNRTLDPTVQQQLFELTEKYHDLGFGAGFQRAGFPYVAVTTFEEAGYKGASGDEFAAVAGKVRYGHKPGDEYHGVSTVDPPGGAVILNKAWWDDIPHLVEALELGHLSGHFAKNMPATPANVLAHEYGHVMHDAVWAAQNWKKNPPINREIMKIVKAASGYDESLIDDFFTKQVMIDGVIANHLGQYATKNIMELVAESFAQYMTGKPSPLAAQIVELFRTELPSTVKYRRIA